MTKIEENQSSGTKVQIVERCPGRRNEDAKELKTIQAKERV